jgi:hypothetical protein
VQSRGLGTAINKELLYDNVQAVNSTNGYACPIRRASANAMNFIKSHKPQRSALWKASLLFILVSGLLIAADQLSIRCGLDGSQRIVDDLLGGLIAGLIFHIYERDRLRRFSKHHQLIDLMNHHIRNALQPLMFVPDESEGKAQMKVVEECVRHIDWALREVLPGKTEERFVVHTGRFVGRNGLTVISLAASSSETSDNHPESFFSQWLDAWRNRGEAGRQ